MNSYYVYCITDPEKCQPFYIGKGKGNRANSHLLPGRTGYSSKRVQDKIRSLRARNIEPVVEMLHTELEEQAAYDIETELIKKYGRKGFEPNGILMNLCEDNRPPKKQFQTLRTREKISVGMIGKNAGNIPWNKGKPHKRGAQTKEQTILVMKTRLKNLLTKIFEYYAVANDQIIKECRDKNIISYNAPISEAALFHIFGQAVIHKGDILQ